MNIVKWLFLLLIVNASARAQQSTRLTGNWEFLKQDAGGIWEIVRPVGKGNPESVPLWTTVQLPHCVNAADGVDPDVNYYQGPAWYRTRLVIDNPYTNGRTLLFFEGAGQKTDVYVYTTKVASHTGGYDEFTVDITDAVAAFRKTAVFQNQFKGKIPIAIRTDNSRDLEMIPSNLSDFNVYGGIYRYLNLVYTPSVAIDKLFAKAETDKAGKTGNVHVTARFFNTPLPPAEAGGKPAAVMVKLIDPAGKLVQQKEVTRPSHSGGGQRGDLSGDISLVDFAVKKPQLWSPQEPVLYTVEATVTAGDSKYVQTEKIGFRHFEFVDHGPFLLNGQRLLLRGTHRHEDHAGVAAAMTEDMMRREMIMMKEMGVNFIRLGHYQQSRIILHLCDSLGILVWEEIPWCRGGLGGPVYQE